MGEGHCKIIMIITEFRIKLNDRMVPKSSKTFSPQVWHKKIDDIPIVKGLMGILVFKSGYKLINYLLIGVVIITLGPGIFLKSN